MNAVDLGELRARDFGYLDAEGHTCLDHTGAGLAPASLVRAGAERITGGVFGNPYSESPASRASGDLLARTRAAVLRHFHADPAEYTVVFTANATAALRLVGESYPFAAPEAGAWSPARVCSSTVLPAPLLPAMITSRRASTSNDTSSNTPRRPALPA